ncbi:MAG: Beta-galactosidase C-terminal domain [Nocardioides sp.]
MTRLVRRLVEEAGIHPVVVRDSSDLEVTRRAAADGRSWVFLVNHGTTEATAEVAGHELVSDAPVAGRLVVPAGGVAVVREA